MHIGPMSSVRPQFSSATAIEDHLDLLVEMGQDFATSLDIGGTLDKALARIAGFLDAEAASLFLLTDNDRRLICRACFGPTNITGLALAADQGIVGRSVQENDCQIVRDVAQDPDFARTVDQESGFTTRSILCAPMSVKDRRVGAIELINKNGGDGLFSEQDRSVLQVLASSAALAIINARLTATVIEQERDRRERDLAAEIQRNLLPRRRGEEYPVCGVNVPARGISGDFFDFFDLEGGRIGFSIGDVSGKGMNAALLMAKTTSLYRCLGKTTDDPGGLLARANVELCETGTRGMFVTMIGGIYDPATGAVRYANAGHEPPMRRSSDGRYERFPAPAPPLGISTDVVGPHGFPVEEIRLDGDALFLFTDGVTECQVAGGGQLELDGLKGLLDELSPIPMRTLLSQLVSRLDRPGRTLHDDLTLMIIDDKEAHMRRPMCAGGGG